MARSTLRRRQLIAIASAGLLTRCAQVPGIGRLTARDIGLPGHQTPAAPDTDPLQQQYDLQSGLSDSPIVFGNQAPANLVRPAQSARKPPRLLLVGGNDFCDLSRRRRAGLRHPKPFQPKEIAFWVPPVPTKLIDPRPNVAVATQTCDAYVTPDGTMCVNDWSAGLHGLEYKGV